MAQLQLPAGLICPALCHVMSCHVMSCHVMSCHVMSCHVILWVHTNMHLHTEVLDGYLDTMSRLSHLAMSAGSSFQQLGTVCAHLPPQ